MKKSIVYIIIVMAVLLAAGGGLYTVASRGKTVRVHLLVAESSVPELVQDAEAVVLGQVETALPSQQTVNTHTGDPSLYTDVMISVERVLKGHVDQRIVIRLPGGSVGTGKKRITMIVEDVPEFRSGERVLLFLGKGTDGLFELPEEHYTVYGWFQGKYRVANERAINPKGSVPLSELLSEIEIAVRQR